MVDNPLRNSILEIRLQTLPSQRTKEGTLTVSDPENQASIPGIYIIKNSETSCFWVGESKNVYERIRKHCTELRSKIHPNSAMQEEFQKIGARFEFYYWRVGSSNRINRNDRVIYESLVQRAVCLLGPNALYNSKVENPTIQFASQSSGGSETGLKKEPGVLRVFCSATNKVYYAHAKNLSQKGVQILNKLKNNEPFNSDLRNDWLLYGETSFSTSIVVSGPEYNSSTVRENKVLEYIEAIGAENTYNNTLKRDTRKKGVRCLKPDGTYTTYSSVSEGARAAGVTTKTFRKWVQNNLNGWSFIP